MGNAQMQSNEEDIYTLCGAQLREARMQANRSLQDVADNLRIRKIYIEAIEEGNLKRIPSETYARGYIKIYCNFLQVDYWRLLESAQQNVSNLNNIEQQNRNVEKSVNPALPTRWVLVLATLATLAILLGFNF